MKFQTRQPIIVLPLCHPIRATSLLLHAAALSFKIEGAGNSLTGLLLPPPAKGTTSADWHPFQSHRSGPLGLQHPSRFLRKYLTPTFIALQSWHCFADLHIFCRSLFRGHGVWRSQLTEMHPSSEYDVPKCWYLVVKMPGNEVLLFCPSLISQGNRLFYKRVSKFQRFYQFSSLYSAVLLRKLTKALSACSLLIC